MFITVGTNDYELATKLGASIKLEQKFKLPLMEIFSNVERAEITELLSILAIASVKANDKDFVKEFKDDLTDSWDYTDLQNAVQELLTRLMFSGSDEQNEKKIDKFPVGEQQKNAFREMLGLPIKVVLAENSLSEQPTE
ncbi:MAG TPA: hypothetical protein VFC76_07915 [Oscillospiraceae bacterium]|nr:hypothetical protein [Oscillospiraceae bacterium]